MAMKRVYTVNDDFFERIDTPQKAYWLGFFLADGNMLIEKGCSYRLGFGLKIDDQPHLEKLKMALDSNYPIKSYQTYSCEIYWRSKKMFEDLLRLGLVPRKSYGYEIPELDELLVPHFVRGIFDGDGNIYHKGKAVKVEISGTPKLCEWLLLVTRTCLGVGGGIRKRSKVNDSWQLQGRCQGILFRDWIYRDAVTFLGRKKDVFDALED